MKRSVITETPQPAAPKAQELPTAGASGCAEGCYSRAFLYWPTSVISSLKRAVDNFYAIPRELISI